MLSLSPSTARPIDRREFFILKFDFKCGMNKHYLKEYVLLFEFLISFFGSTTGFEIIFLYSFRPGFLCFEIY